MTKLRCLNKKCNNENGVTLNLDDFPQSVEIRCPYCGPSYLYRSETGWESAEQRMNRMRRQVTCSCGAIITDYKTGEHGRSKCDTCLAADDLKISRGRIARNNESSPWYVGRNLRTKEGQIGS